MKILNWNTQAAKPHSTTQRFFKIQKIVTENEPDVVCLTEAYPETLPVDGHTISSGLSGWGNFEKAGARKVNLWSKHSWYHVDEIGSSQLPEGRFIKGITTINGIELTIIGVCIPYHAYRNSSKWAENRKHRWQGACDYLDVLRQDILSQEIYSRRTIIIGDFNLQIPPKNYPHPSEIVNKKREETFATWSIPTAGEFEDAALDKRFIDHLALTSDFQVKSVKFISRFDKDDAVLSDHNGVVIEVQLI
jgi:endonuclease/exonuclease/phosphatase family metal-dependent hydrolase